MHIRHEYIKSDVVNTIFGLVKFNHLGLVTNYEELGTRIGDATVPIRREDLLLMPGFLDAELFPIEGVNLDDLPPEPIIVDPNAPPPPKEWADKDYWLVIEELCQGGENMNHLGMVTMDVLLPVLKERGMPIISGNRRKEITEKFKTF